jgi:hypothetical protein
MQHVINVIYEQTFPKNEAQENRDFFIVSIMKAQCDAKICSKFSDPLIWWLYTCLKRPWPHKRKVACIRTNDNYKTCSLCLVLMRNNPKHACIIVVSYTIEGGEVLELYACAFN